MARARPTPDPFAEWGPDETNDLALFDDRTDCFGTGGAPIRATSSEGRTEGLWRKGWEPSCTKMSSEARADASSPIRLLVRRARGCNTSVSDNSLASPVERKPDVGQSDMERAEWDLVDLTAAWSTKNVDMLPWPAETQKRARENMFNTRP